MNLLKTISDAPDATGFRHRVAVRAVVHDSQGRVALLAVTKKGYHKLPGGGIEKGEDQLIALYREIQEELGCQVDVTGDIGLITEYRDEEKLHQESYCYSANLKGEMEKPAFTEDELADGFAIRWVTSLSEAIAILTKDAPTDYNGVFIQKRDLAFLEAAQNLATT